MLGKKQEKTFILVSCAVVVWHKAFPTVECISIRRGKVHHLRLISLDAPDEAPAFFDIQKIP